MNGIEWLTIFLLSIGFCLGVVTIVGNLLVWTMDNFKEYH